MVSLPAFGQLFEVGMAGFAGGANNWPDGEVPRFAIDGLGQKYLNFGEFDTGVAVTPAGNLAPASITVWAANDSEPRDPTSFSVYGTNDPIGALTPGDLLGGLNLIASDAIGLPSSRNGGGATPLDSLNSASVAFANTAVYDSYVVVFPGVKDEASANSMQIAEVQLYGAAGAPLFSPNDTIQGGLLVPEPATGLMALLCLIPLCGRIRRR